MKIKGLHITLSEKDNASSEAFEKVLRKFKKAIRNAGILKELRDRMAFMKPSEKKRKKRLAKRK